MSDLFIPGSKSMPEIRFCREGDFSMEGRSMGEDPRVFFKRVNDWIKGSDKLSNITLNIKLEYFNTGSSKLILEMLARLIENNGKEQLTVNWHYEEGDDDMYESGKFFEKILNCRFSYNSYSECLCN